MRARKNKRKYHLRGPRHFLRYIGALVLDTQLLTGDTKVAPVERTDPDRVGPA